MGLIEIVGGIFEPIKDIISEVVVDKDKRDQINLELAQIEDAALARADSLMEGQIEVNKVEAASGSIFVAGWRPFVGWVGGVALAYSSILQPLFSWTAQVVFGYKGSFPILDNTLLITIMTGMLGLGVQRTFEKVKGVSTNDMRDVPTRVQEASATVTTEVSTSVTPIASPTIKPKKKHFHIF